jgi:intracellular sulfur oxidation DsrE/DsrF family protein
MMEQWMIDLRPKLTEAPARRSLFGRLAGAAVLGLAGLAPATPRAETLATRHDPLDWPGKLKGRHRQVVDAYEINSGRPLAFAHAFLATNAAPNEATALVVLRSQAFPIALNSDMWRKYQIGESFEIIDPQTKEPAVKNPFLNPRSGVLPSDEMAIDWLLGQGVLFAACNLALQGQSQKLASVVGVSADGAAEEWAVNLVPGITLLPSGVWGLNRAQEAGCTYCTGGG